MVIISTFDNLRQGYFSNEKDRINMDTEIVPGAVVAADYNNDGSYRCIYF